MAFIGIFNFIISGERVVVQRGRRKKEAAEGFRRDVSKAAPFGTLWIRREWSSCLKGEAFRFLCPARAAPGRF
jgi:hypothetical protein